MKKKILVFLITIILGLGFFVIEARAGSEHNVYGWAWSSNIGWISFNSTNCDPGSPRRPDTNTDYSLCPGSYADYGVHIDPDTGLFSGGAWSSNIGWISFGDFDGDGDIDDDDKNISDFCAPNCEALFDFDTKQVSGWARVLSLVGQPLETTGGWDGWIKLRGANYGVSFNTSTNELEGWAWSENIGWISFNCKDGGYDESGGEESSSITGEISDGFIRADSSRYSTAQSTSNGFNITGSGLIVGQEYEETGECEGTAPGCDEIYQLEEGCAMLSGCYWVGCVGTPPSCDTYTDQAECGYQYGCSWDGCTGTATSCDSFDSTYYHCVTQTGCFWDGCTGTATSCPYWDGDQSGCEGQDGCNYLANEGKCVSGRSGVTPCDSYSGESSCESQDGCSWDGCEGRADECSTYSLEGSCESQDGCGWDGCTGTPTPCEDLDYDCPSGCDWLGCEGTSDPCYSFNDDVDCDAQLGCYWDKDEEFGVNRDYLDFDTSNIPDDANITDVKLSLKVDFDRSGTDFDVEIYKFFWSEPITSSNREANYDADGALYDAVWRNTSGMSAEVYYDSPSLDNSWVNVTGDTKYQLRSSRDVNEDEPNRNEYIVFYSADSSGNEPILKVTYTTGTGLYYDICGISDYKVMANLNLPPDKPTTQKENWGACGGMPQIAFRTSVILNWIYSDPEGDPQAAYEVWVDQDSNFTGLKFNNKVDPGSCLGSPCSYTLDLADDEEGDWLSVLTWGITYWWKVMVWDSQGNESELSDPESFTIPNRASPNAGFFATPANPRKGEEVVFTDISECYLSDDSEYDCNDGGDQIEYEWDFGDASPKDTFKGNTTHTYADVGSYVVRLEVTDSGVGQGVGTCYEEMTVGLPLPKWREISPF